MKRSPLQRKTPLRTKAPARRERASGSPELAAALRALLATPVERPRAVMALALPTPAAPVLKTPDRKDQRIRDSARGEACTIRVPGCNGGGETTVWCHLPEAVAGRGLGLKGIDILGAYGCNHCHDVVDRRAPRPARLTEQDVALAFYRAMARSLVRLRQKGLA